MPEPVTQEQILSSTSWLIYTAAKCGMKDTKRNHSRLRAALRDLLTKTLGRKPTKEELESAMNCF